MRPNCFRRAALVAVVAAGIALPLTAPEAADAAAALPKIAQVTPAVGPLAGGTRVTVVGSGFRQVRAVQFGTAMGGSITVLSATKLRVTAPRHSAGTINIRVRTFAGTSATARADRFSYLPRPVISAVTPSRGRVAGGATTTLIGSGFSHVAAVVFGSSKARSWKRISDTKIVAVSPTRPAGAVDVRVRTAGGTSPTSTRDRFAFVSPPSVTSISPTAGPLAGGGRVTVSGTNFTAITSVRFGSTAASNVTVLSATRLQLTAPPGTSGTTDVRVSGGFGASRAVTADRYSYVDAPSAPTVAVATAPGPFGPDTSARPQIRDTACTDSTCYGIGFYETDVADVPIIETLIDGNWSWSYAPRPADAVAPSAAQLYSIWCGTDTCVAVGAYFNTHGNKLPLVETLSGGVWTASSGGHPSSVVAAYFDGIACVSATACVASGLAPGGSILATLNGATWSSQFMPMPAGKSVTNVSRTGIACGSATFCVFAGDYFDGAALHAFAETYNGSTWTPALLSDPAGGAAYSMLDGVSCPSASRCVAVGGYGTADNTSRRTLIASEDHGTWTTASGALPAGAVPDAATGLTRLDTIACLAGKCTAAGEYDGPNGVDGFVDVLDNGLWSARTVAKSGDSSVNRVFFSSACATSSKCVAVGEDNSGSAHTTGVIAVNTPGGTAQAQVPLPTGITDTDISLRQVACSSSGVCSAIAVLSTSPSQWLLITITT